VPRHRDHHASRGLIIGSLVFFIGFGLGLHYLFGHYSWPVSIISSVVTTILWSVVMGLWLGVLARPKQ